MVVTLEDLLGLVVGCYALGMFVVGLVCAFRWVGWLLCCAFCLDYLA